MRALWGCSAVLLALASFIPVDSAYAQRTQSPAFIGASSAPTAGAAPWMETWIGGGATDTWAGGWAGAVIALNPTRNVWTDGVVVRIDGVAGRYDISPVFGGHATHEAGSVLLGYRAVIGSTNLTGYMGLNAENHSNPDPFATIGGTNGSDVGAKVLGEIYTLLAPSFDFYAQASYSTVFDTWTAYARVGYQLFPTVWIGPEAQVYGSNAPYREARVGAYVKLDKVLFGSDLIVSGGYRDPITNGDSGYYATLTLASRFY